MAEIFPSNFFVAADSLSLELGATYARSEGGLVVASRNSDPFWRGRITTPRLPNYPGNNLRAVLIAFLTRAVDLNLRLDFIHPKHFLPSSYTAETWPMVGDAGLVDVPDLRTLVVPGLPVGLILKRGDRLSVLQGDIIVHRWIADDMVVASTISQAVTVTPRLPIGVLAPGAVVKLKNPPMRFMIVPGSWDDSSDSVEPVAVSFEVMEALR